MVEKMGFVQRVLALRFILPSCPFHDSPGNVSSRGAWRSQTQPEMFPRAVFMRD